ncbi:MAG: hypothetical protein JW969_05495 [Spirochaetales bacterium]|nr:hypothetical protein [Spirochaetales bacterium]
MSSDIKLTLPERKKSMNGGQKIIILLLSLILLTGFAILFVVIFTNNKGPSGNALSFGMDKQEVKDLALKYQKQGLVESAAETWTDYISISNPDPRDKAAIVYTIGKIYQEAGNYEKALEYYYKSEAIYRHEDLAREISLKVQECLENLGKFAALREELASRVGETEETKADDVVAEIGPEKITKADLDQKIEQQINLQLSFYSAYMDQEAINRQKEQLFRQYASDEGRFKMLNQYIVEELLYRKAREEKLADVPETRALLTAMEKQLLAQSLLTGQFKDKINLTETDIKNYYEANRADYIKEGQQKSFDDVKQEVYQALRSAKEKEIEQALIQRLKQSYDVVIHTAKFKMENDEKKSK